MTSTVISDLNAEWNALTSTGDFADRFDSWCYAWPALALVADSGQPPRFNTQHLSPEQIDQTLHALIRAHHDGDRYAGRIVLQCLVACVERVARKSVGRYSNLDEAAQVATAAAWEAIQTYDLARTTGVATRIWSRTLTAVCPPRKKHQIDEIPFDPTTMPSLRHTTSNPLDGEDILGSVGEVLRLIAWGLDEKVLTSAEAALLTRLYGDNANATPGDEIAAELGISHAALRQRASRAVRRLARAVQTAL